MVKVLIGPLKSFKIDRKSDFATNLKSLISDHLLLFLPHLSDDVLAEYITVLVCNGKNQAQARDDLEDFLGERTPEFISWLWKLLLKNENKFTAVISSDQKETSHNRGDAIASREVANTNKIIRDLQSQGKCDSDNLMGEGEKVCGPSTQAYNSSDMATLDCYKKIMERSIQPSLPHGKLAQDDVLAKGPSSVKKHRTERVDNNAKTAALLEKDSPCLPRGLTALPESALKKGLSSLPLDPSSHISKPRGSVWDRLGKPIQEVQCRSQRADFCVTEKAQHSGEQIDQYSPMIHKRDEQIDQESRRLRQKHIAEEDGTNQIDGSRGADHVDNISSQALSVSNIRRKRHFGEISSQADPSLAMKKETENQSGFVCLSSKKTEVQKAASQDVVSQVQDVKLRLHQMEIEMAKLRSKQVVMEKDGKKKLSANSGVVKLTQADTESRTVVVTNVHYTATKETISMFFRKCGAVISVDIITDRSDTLPSVPGSSAAHITFESKEAADKALAFSGASFYSRTIKVSRKGEVTHMTPKPAQFACKQMRTSYSKSNVDPDRFPISGPHLQWRRVSLASAQTETLASISDQANALPVSDSAGDSKQGLSSSSYKSANTVTLTA